MGLFDFLSGTKCPACGAKGARKTEARVSCPNRSCSYYDSSLGREAPSAPEIGMDVAQPATGSVSAAAASRRGGRFSAQRPLVIRYRNFEGVEKAFTGDAESAVRKKNHIVVRVEPTGQRITLCRDRIQNLGEVEASFPQPVAPGQPWPTARERQVLGYHKKHGSTSPLYEQIRARYPDW